MEGTQPGNLPIWIQHQAFSVDAKGPISQNAIVNERIRAHEVF